MKAQIGRCYDSLGKRTEAIKSFKDALKNKPDRLDVMWELALLYKQQGDINAAKENAESVLKYDMEKYNALNNIGGLTDKELKENCHLLLGDMAFAANKLDEAKKHYEAIDCWIKLAELAFSKEKYEDVIEYAKSAILKDTSADKKECSAAYYYWAISLVQPYINKDILTTEEQKEIEKVVFLLKQAIPSDKAEVFHNLGCLYGNKKYGIRDAPKALKYYEIAAQKKFPGSLRNLAIKYENGEDVERDEGKAFAYCSEAAELGVPEAQADLARYYLNGIGCAVDHESAKSWAAKAAETLPLAKYYLAVALEFEFSITQNEELIPQIIQLASDAAEADVVGANFSLGRDHEFGNLVKQDFALAEYYYRNAIRLGSKEARDNLLLMYFVQLEKMPPKDQGYNTTVCSCQELLLVEMVYRGILLLTSLIPLEKSNLNAS